MSHDYWNKYYKEKIPLTFRLRRSPPTSKHVLMNSDSSESRADRIIELLQRYHKLLEEKIQAMAGTKGLNRSVAAGNGKGSIDEDKG